MLIVYSTLGCHLCEQALAIIHYCLPDVEIKIIDIADNDELMERYGIRIPVVQKSETGDELGWPFDDVSFDAWYQSK